MSINTTQINFYNNYQIPDKIIDITFKFIKAFEENKIFFNLKNIFINPCFILLAYRELLKYSDGIVYLNEQMYDIFMVKINNKHYIVSYYFNQLYNLESIDFNPNIYY